MNNQIASTSCQQLSSDIPNSLNPSLYAPGSTIFNVAGDHYTSIINNIDYSNISEDPILADIPYAQGAAFKPERACLPGTRVDIRQKIIAWVENPDSAAMLWLTGFAGAGKSAIGHAIAKYFHSQRRLGSSFFFDRAHQSSRRPDNLFSTIACDVIRLDQETERSFLDIIRNDRGLRTSTSPHRQFHELLLAPNQARDSNTPIVVVIDALDESGNREERAEILSVLRDAADQLRPGFRFFITSRFEEDIADALGGNPHIDMERIHDIDRQSTDADIYLMLTKVLPKISILDTRYPHDEWRHMIVRKSEGIFQWAATACRVILGSGKRQNHRKQFDMIMATGSQLYSLYLTILTNTFDTEDEEDLEIFRTILGAILIAREPLTLDALKHLYPDHDAEFVIAPLGSLLSGTADNDSIAPLHTSFRDFLVDSANAGVFLINSVAANKHMSHSVLDCINRDLHFNLGTLKTSYHPTTKTVDLPHHISYSCHFWAEHIKSKTDWTDDCILNKIRLLFRSNFLYWLEVLSLTGIMHVADPILADASQFTEDEEVSSFASDARKFVSAFAVPISLSAPHIYISALPFAPLRSKVAKRYKSHFRNILQVIRGAHEHWPSLQSIFYAPDDINSVAFSSDGLRVVSGSKDTTVRIWNALTGEQIGPSLTGHNNWVNSVSFSPDGTRIVSGSDDRTIRIWDVPSGQQIGPALVGHDNSVESVAFSADGTRIVSGSRDKTIRIWDALSGQQIGPFHIEHDHWINSVSFSPNGNRVVSGSNDKAIIIWDALTWRKIGLPLVGHENWVNSVAFSFDGTRIVSGSLDKTLRIWDVSNGQQIGPALVGHDHSVDSVSFSPDGARVVSGSRDKTIRIWDVPSGQQIGPSLIGHDHWVTSVSFSFDGTRIISGSRDRTIRIWDVPSGPKIGLSHIVHDDWVNSVSISPSGNLVVSGSSDKTLKIWDLLTGQQVGRSLVGHKDQVTSVTFSSNGILIVSGSLDRTLRIWDVSNGQQSGPALVGHDLSVDSVSFSPDAARIVSGSGDGTIRIWDVSTGEQIGRSLFGQNHWVTSVSFSPDGTRIVSGSDDRTIRIWDVLSGQQIGRSLVGHDHWIRSVSFSTDGTRIASGSNDKTVRIWDVSNGQQIGSSLVGHDDWVNSVSFSPDSTRIASGSSDNTIKIWGASSGQQIGPSLIGHGDWVNSVSFSPEGTRLVSVSNDKTIRIWDVSNDAISALTTVQHAFGQNIDKDGWVRGPQGELYFWIPPVHRTVLYRPLNTCIIGGEPTRLDLTNFVHGTAWDLCMSKS